MPSGTIHTTQIKNENLWFDDDSNSTNHNQITATTTILPTTATLTSEQIFANENLDSISNVSFNHNHENVSNFEHYFNDHQDLIVNYPDNQNNHYNVSFEHFAPCNHKSEQLIPTPLPITTDHSYQSYNIDDKSFFHDSNLIATNSMSLHDFIDNNHSNPTLNSNSMIGSHFLNVDQQSQQQQFILNDHLNKFFDNNPFN